MNTPKEILNRIQKHKGRALDLNNPRDRSRFFSAIQRGFDVQAETLRNVRAVLNGASTYDQTQYKTILDSRRII